MTLLDNKQRADATAIAQDSSLRGRTIRTMSTAIACLGAAAMAGAQEAPVTQDDSSSTALQEVRVTASKRSEALSKSPLAVSALSLNQLQDAGVVAVKDLTSAVPNVQIHTIGVDSFVGITIRGISNQDYSGTADPAVSTYIDGVYVGLSQGFASELYDLERLEVLRGPQGTLYGRNATGGNLNIITADPKPEFGASADIAFGNHNDVQSHGMVNLPLSDTFKLRGAVMLHRNDGYFDSRGTTARNYGASDDFGGRLTALWTPTADFKWRFSLDQFVSQGTPWASIQTGEDGKPVNGLPIYDQPISSDPEPDNYIRNFSVRSRMDLNLGDAWSLAYTSGYQNLDAHYWWATTGQVAAPADTGWKQFVGYSASFQTHEIDVNFDTERLKNTFGGSYFEQRGPYGPGAGVYPAIGYESVSYGPFGRPHKSAWGVFDQATYSLTDRLRVTGGVRYSSENQSEPFGQSIACVGSPLPYATLQEMLALTSVPEGCFLSTSPAGKGTSTSTTWKAGLELDASDATLTYLSVSTGFKSGGVQPSVPAPLPTTFKPEKVTNYELGVKTHLLDSSLNIRTALFYEDYTDLQVFQIMPLESGIALVTDNAAKAAIYGIELEYEWRLSPLDQISGFINYLHATYTEYEGAVDGRTGAVVGSLSGNQLPNAPEKSLRLQYSHDFKFGNGGKLTPLVAFYWQSSSYMRELNEPLYEIDSYSKTNASLTYVDPTSHWRVSAFADNLENEAVRNSSWASAGMVYSDYGQPRTYGLRVSVEY